MLNFMRPRFIAWTAISRIGYILAFAFSHSVPPMKLPVVAPDCAAVILTRNRGPDSQNWEVVMAREATPVSAPTSAIASVNASIVVKGSD